ncbi:uncharacterized protein Z518_08488 [Rhinocladiella mackenziei CBS 650.93]|uniref:Rhinocladiella mackenziei CBS 650.93 unplaced genomic scaffold supercont1.6, whole genome shotgun sequence n=1 Tax=Rhinocladiella mackenziei CBS 650.93 TaxID=1442369 RepID=A0A0D2FKV1_9EURO|nr:uncharacterized protein Z518_08488 [Rhinocladiella mackenziei CBS 650.93]KIX02547.1 hypothetical protein Z518_08488 [Rhinocladiella mackenziei CBS 650.93]
MTTQLSASSTTSSAPATASASSSPLEQGTSAGLSEGAKAGIGVGASVGAILLVIVTVILTRWSLSRPKNREEPRYDAAAWPPLQEMTSNYQEELHSDSRKNGAIHASRASELPGE